MGDHTESMQVDFDPAEISFAEIATLFWQSHNPCATAYSLQYRSAIWFHDQSQREILEDAKTPLWEKYQRDIVTPVLPLGPFYLAEDYHQKYRLQGRKPLFKAFQQIYPKFDDFNASTSAARINGFLSGNGKRLFLEESQQYGIDEDLLNEFLRF